MKMSDFDLSPKAQLSTLEIEQMHQDFSSRLHYYRHHTRPPFMDKFHMIALEFGTIYLNQESNQELTTISQLTRLIDQCKQHLFIDADIDVSSSSSSMSPLASLSPLSSPPPLKKKRMIRRKRHRGLSRLLSMCYNNRASKRCRLGQHSLAIRDYGRAIRLESDFSIYYFNRAQAYDELIGKKEESTDGEDDRVGDNNNDDSDDVNGSENGDDNDDKDEEDYFNDNVQIDERSNVERLGIDRLAWLSYRDYCDAIQIDDKLVAAYYGRSSIYFRNGQYERAIGDLSRMIELDSSCIFTRSQRCACLERLGKLVPALHDIEVVYRTLEFAGDAKEVWKRVMFQRKRDQLRQALFISSRDRYL